MTRAKNLLYTAKVYTTGSREEGTSRGHDGRLEIENSVPACPVTALPPNNPRRRLVDMLRKRAGD